MDILAILEPIFPTVRESLIRNLDRIQKGEKFEEDQGIEDKIKEILKKIDLKPRKKL